MGFLWPRILALLVAVAYIPMDHLSTDAAEVCTPEGVTVDCAHAACIEHVPGSCFNTTELSQSLIPNMKECYAERYPELINAALLWNERVNRGIPAIAIAQGVGTMEAKHMQMDIALMFDHWDIIDTKIKEILEIDPNDPHALFAKAMYGFEGVLPSVSPDEVPAILELLESHAPATAKAVDRSLADVKMVWNHEFLHPFVPGNSQEWKDNCEIGMDSPVLSELFPNFECYFVPEQFNPASLAIIAFGASGGNVLEARIEAVRSFAALYPQATILATGGALETDRAEGDLMLEALPEYADRIVVDRLARDTIGNCLAISEWLLENDIGNVFSLTSTYHNPRALMACRGVFQRMGIKAKTYMVAAGNHVQAPLGSNWTQDNQDWLETAYGGTGRFRAIEIPMTNRDFARGAGLFTMCDFQELEGSRELPITTTDVFIQSGEVSESSVIIMARCNSEVDSQVTLMLNGEKNKVSQVHAANDHTISFKVEGLTSNTKYTYQVECLSLTDANVAVEARTSTGAKMSVEGSFKTAPSKDEEVAFNFVWVADLAGQGWGRNPDFELTNTKGEVVKGGYVVFDTMEDLEPEFALFQGDMIYADNAIPPVKEVSTGGFWTNNPSKDFVAVTLDEFRANWKYNFGDEKMQSFLAKTPVYVQWDDHEVTNNWWPGETLGPDQYAEGTAVNRLFDNSLQAFYEYNPIEEGQLLYRSQRYGKHVEIFFVDYRSYRGPNPDNDKPEPSTMFGAEQLEWFKAGLLASDATWKIISSHDPFGIVTGGPGDRDAFGQEDPRILGREHEVKEILEMIHKNGITGVVSLTSDVHFTAHVNMHPDRAEGNFTDFSPLDEFVIGPIHAGSFGPNFMDTSFGARYEYEYGPLTAGFERWANLPPSHYDLQSFGHAAVSEDGTLEIKLIGIDGSTMFNMTLPPVTVPPSNKDTPTTPSSAGSKSAFLTVAGMAVFAAI